MNIFKSISSFIIAFTFLGLSNGSAQSIKLRSLSGFVFFTKVGAISNAATSTIFGDIGTCAGAVTGFDSPSTHNGTVYQPGPETNQAALDIDSLYNDLSATTNTNTTHTAVFGGGETLFSGVYYVGGASSINGTLNLDAQGNPNALFIFKVLGAFSTGASTTVHLLNGARACNVFWVAEGAISTGADTDIKGTLLAHNAAGSMAAGGKLQGRLLSSTGAIAVSTGNFSVTTGCVCSGLPNTSTWLGVDNNWLNTNNWCGSLPTATTNVILPLGISNYPVITNLTITFKDINIESGASLIISSTGVLSLYGNVNSVGTIDLREGTLNLAGINTSIGGSAILNGTVKNLTISGSNSSIKAGNFQMLSIKNNLSFLTSNNTFTTNDNLSLLSNDSITASVTDITKQGTLTGNQIVGNVYVERFIPELKRWRYVAINTEAFAGSKNTVQANWMEGQLPGVNTGTLGRGIYITDPSFTVNPSNFDTSSVSASMKYFNGTSYVGIGDPTTFNIRSHPSYFTYIRGDRNCTATNGLTSSTVLRSFGKLIQGDKVLAVPSGANGTATGNPYASAIDLRKVLFSKGGIINIYVWDPKLGGAFGQGAFQLLTRDPFYNGEFTILPGGGSYGSQTTMNTIESGLGFFVQGSDTARNLTFTENSKNPSQNNAFRTSDIQQRIEGRLGVIESNGSLTMSDAFQVRFASNYSNTISLSDSKKRSSGSENIAVVREGTLLTMEYRNLLKPESDTIFINIANMRPKNYLWCFTMTALNGPGKVGVLVDKFLGTETLLRLDSINNYNFTVTSAAASFDPQRFKIVINQVTVLPLAHINLLADRKPNGTIALNWKVENEANINHYEIVKSNNANIFSPFGLNTAATANNGSNGNYAQIDVSPFNGENYYRVKAVYNDGHILYSQVVRVKPMFEDAMISIYPNPVSNKTIALYLNGLKEGSYNLSLTDNIGKVVYFGSMIVNVSSFKKEIALKNNIATGNYQLKITNETGFKNNIAVTIVN